MKKRNLPQNKKTAQRVPRREGDPIPWRYCFLTLICGVILVGGFFLAARQHFSAMDYGIKNAKLRQEKENLEARRLNLKYNREITLAPDAIRKAARKYGFREMTASNIDVSSRKPPEKTKPETALKPASENANKETAKIENREEKKIAKTAKEETKKTETKTDKKKDSAR
jgi:hypothetical protein